MKKKKNFDVDDELILVSSLRYSIGRHSYISCLASSIAKKYYDVLMENEMADNISKEIITCINDCFRYMSIGLEYDSTITYEERDAMSDIINFLNNNIKNKEETYGIKTIEVYKKDYKTETPKEYNVIKNDRLYNFQSQWFYIDTEIENLLEWYTLAQVLNKSCHKQIKIKSNDGIKEITVVPTFERQFDIEEKNGAYLLHKKEVKYKICYIPLEKAKCGQYNYKVIDENIIKE